MPDLAMALLALAPPTDSGVWLEAPPKPGTVLTAPLDVTGETRALEGVLSVRLYVVRGESVRLVETYEPLLPVGTIPFELTLDPEGMAPGRVTLRVVATTPTRGLSAEIPGLMVPRAGKPKPTDTGLPRRVVRAAPVRAVGATPRRTTPAAPALDTSGRAFGRTAPVLPYRPVPPPPVPIEAGTSLLVPEPVAAQRSAWLSVAGGLLLLVTSSHLHRMLRTQPDPEDAR